MSISALLRDEAEEADEEEGDDAEAEGGRARKRQVARTGKRERESEGHGEMPALAAWSHLSKDVNRIDQVGERGGWNISYPFSVWTYSPVRICVRALPRGVRASARAARAHAPDVEDGPAEPVLAGPVHVPGRHGARHVGGRHRRRAVLAAPLHGGEELGGRVVEGALPEKEADRIMS